MEIIEFFIPHNVPSLKNNKVMTKFGIVDGKTIKNYYKKFNISKLSVNSVMSERVRVYAKKENLFLHYRPYFNKLKELKTSYGLDIYPIVCGMHFVRDGRRKFDLHNAVQVVADMFTAHNFINDDDADHFVIMPYQINDCWYSIDQDKPGVFIRLKVK
jgi:hypothetical protein